MFRQVKSALFWYYLYKFRKKVLIIAFLLILALFANAIYGDIVQYLTLKQKLEYLEIALMSKWVIIIFNLLFSLYLLLTLFKSEEKEKKEIVKEEKKENKTIESNEKSDKNTTSKFTKREEKFLKKELKSRSDLLVER